MDMQTIAILLHSTIRSDYRVIKTVRTLARQFEIVLFFHGRQADVLDHFADLNNVRCIAMQERMDIKRKILRHTFLCYEYDYMSDEIFKLGLKFDIVWANDLPTLSPASIIAKEMKAKLIYDAHEIYSETINQFFVPSKNLFKNIVFQLLVYIMQKHSREVEAELVQKIDLMFTVNESLKEYFLSKYRIRKVEVLMNLPNISADKGGHTFDFRSHFSWPADTIVVLYQGGLNAGRGLDLLIDSFSLLDSSFRLVILGEGILKSGLEAKVNDLNLMNTIGFYEFVPLQDLPRFTRGANIGVNLLENFNLSKQWASPNKLFEYIHANIPVVASNTVENMKVFHKYKVGETCENIPIDIADKIKQISRDTNQYAAELNRAKTEYSWENHEENILRFVNSID